MVTKNEVLQRNLFGVQNPALCIRNHGIGHWCTSEGWLPDQSRVEKVTNWGPCKDLTDVRAFLGTIGVCWLFIRNFTHQAHHLVKLTQKGTEWEFSQKQLEAMANLKDMLVKSPALRPIDYKSNAPVILSVDISYSNWIPSITVRPKQRQATILCKIQLDNTQ